MGLCCRAQPVMLYSALDEGKFGRDEAGVQECTGGTEIYCALKCAL